MSRLCGSAAAISTSLSLLIALLATGAIAQTAGNLVAVNKLRIVEVFATGGSTTLTTLPAGQSGLGACPSADNRGVALLTHQLAMNRISYHLIEMKSGVLRTLGVATKVTGVATRLPAGSVVPDQRGDYIAATSIGVIRFDGTTGLATTLQTAARDGICRHLNTGGWLTFAGPAIYSLQRPARQTRVLTQPGPIALVAGDLFPDPTTGDALFASGTVMRLNVVQQTLTTFARIGGARCGTVDPKTGDGFVGTTTRILRVNPQGGVRGTLTTVSGGANGLALVGSNHLPGNGSAQPGTTYALLASFPGNPGRFYQIGVSLGFLPGIRTPSGTIPLNPDPLFGLGFASPSIFRSFSGQLSANGSANASIAIPNAAALTGVLLYLAAVAYDGGGTIHAISRPRTLVIE